MVFPNYILILILVVSTFASIITGSHWILRRKTKLSLWFGLLLISQAIEVFCYLLHWIVKDNNATLLVSFIQMFAYLLLCVFWLILVIEFTNHRRWFRPLNIGLISLIPAIVLSVMVARWNQGFDDLPIEMNTLGMIAHSPLLHGWPTTINLFFSYGVVIFSLVILLDFYFKTTKLLKISTLPFFAGALLLLVFGTFELLNLDFFSSVSSHQLAIAGISLMPFLVIIDPRFKNMLSSAHEMVIKQMHDAVIILDNDNRIIEINSTGERLFRINNRQAKKKPLSIILPEGVSLTESELKSNRFKEEIRVEVDGVVSSFDSNITQLFDPYGEPLGRVVVFRNITERDIIEKELLEGAKELKHTYSLLSSLAEVNSNLQTVSKLAEITDVLGQEFEKLGLVCFIAEIKSSSDELHISYLSCQPGLLGKVQKILRDKIIGFRLERKQFAELYRLIDTKEVSFKSFIITDFDDDPDSLPINRLEQIIRMIGLQPEMETLVLPLVSRSKTLGIMGVWGSVLRETDIGSFKIFANQLAQVMEKAILEEEEIKRAKEDNRSNKLLFALSNAASLLGSTSNSTLAYDILGKKISEIGLNCAVVKFDQTWDNAFIRYLSFSPELIRQIEEITGIQTKNFSIARRFWPGDRVVTAKKSSWYSNPNIIFRKMFPMVPQAMAKKAFKLLGFGPDDQLCILPLIQNDHTIGAMPIWGPTIKIEDTSILEIFSNQVAGILQNMSNYESEIKRTDELSRSSAMIIALSKVSAQLDTSTNLAQVFETLGTELKKVHINCMVGTLDTAKQSLKIEYLSILPEISKLVKHMKTIWPKDVTIPRHLWPTDKAVTEKIPFWDVDPIGNTRKMFPFIPKSIFLKTFDKAGMNPDDQVCYLPLISEEDVIGILAVWGPFIKNEDIPGLSVFSNQVASAIKNARLYDQAQNEISTRKEAEARIQQSLNEKEVLLKEVHHRVKNNLQVISSLLNLQSAQCSDPATIANFQESQNRVRSMALIHEKLYQSPDLEHVDFGSYLHSLVNSLASTYRINFDKVKLSINSDNISLNIDTAIPCGLIVNELVSNSLKYAFPDGKSGKVLVSCNKLRGDLYQLLIQDTGIGLPADFSIIQGNSLGLKLVSSLVKQIDGELKVIEKKGTCFEILFRHAE